MTKPAGRPPEEFEPRLHADKPVRLRLLGPSSQGWIYHTPSRDACYRLLPIDLHQPSTVSEGRRADDAPLLRRESFLDWKSPPDNPGRVSPAWTKDPRQHHLAPITEADQSSDPANPNWFYVRYEIPFANSLGELLARADPLTRLRHLIRILDQMPGWWADLQHEGLLPMPADIVFDANGQPFLLPAPFWRFPDADAVFSEPSRGLYLAPEYVRGRGGAGREVNMDRYALGVLLLCGFRKAPRGEDGAARVLQRAANGSLWEGSGLESTLPYWLQKLEATAEAERAVRRLFASDLKARSAVDPTGLAQQLKEFLHRMEPRVAVQELLDCGRGDEAYALLQDILLSDDSWEMLMLAGRAARATGRPLEAVDFYEKAIARSEHLAEAHEAQFDTLVSEECRKSISRLIEHKEEVGRLVDDRVWRDFLVIEQNGPSTDGEEKYAGHMLWRRQIEKAMLFIYERLRDSESQVPWRKLPLRFRYIQALLSAGSADRALLEINAIHDALYHAHRERGLSPDVIQEHWQTVEAFRALLAALSSPRSS